MYTGQTVFSQIMDFIPKYEFQKCVLRYQSPFAWRGEIFLYIFWGVMVWGNERTHPRWSRCIFAISTEPRCGVKFHIHIEKSPKSNGLQHAICKKIPYVGYCCIVKKHHGILLQKWDNCPSQYRGCFLITFRRRERYEGRGSLVKLWCLTEAKRNQKRFTLKYVMSSLEICLSQNGLTNLPKQDKMNPNPGVHLSRPEIASNQAIKNKQ